MKKVSKTLYGVVRCETYHCLEFTVTDELTDSEKAAQEIADRIKRSRKPFNKNAPVSRIAKFELREV